MKYSINIEQLEDTDLPIVIYGTGGQAQRLYNYLLSKGINAYCFCVTKNQNSDKTFLELPKYEYNELKSVCSSYILLIATIVEIAKEIVMMLEENNEQNKYYHMRMPFKLEDDFIESSYIESEDIKSVRSLFEDEISQKIYDLMLRYKQTGNQFQIHELISGVTFFDEPLLDADKRYTYIDCAAFTGDTIVQFLQFNGVKYKKIIGIEMEEGNFEDLTNFVKFAMLPRVELINKGLWSCEKIQNIKTKKGGHYFNTNLFTSIHQVTKEEDYLNNIDEAIQEVKLKTIDNLFYDKYANIEIDVLIKLNAMCADVEILKGATKLIKDNKPTIVLEYGVSLEHIVEIPKLLKELGVDYKIYLRVKSVNNDTKIVMYCF